MQDPNGGAEQNLWIWIFSVLLAGITTIGGYVVTLFQGRMQKLEEEMKERVTREALRDYLIEIGQQRERMHDETLDRITEIRNDIKSVAHEFNRDIDRVHQRIDGVEDRRN